MKRILSKAKQLVIKSLRLVCPSFLLSQKSFSQDGEDIVLAAFIHTHPNYKGFYVDIGAHHPYRFSNTAIFYHKGWTGINIEPTPSLLKAFKRYRKRDVNLNVGISDVNSELTFYEFNEPAFNSFDRDLSLSRVNSQYRIISEKKIPVSTLEKILDENLPKNQKIDFFTIDVEGFDLNVLKSNNWEKYSADYILVENKIDIEDFSRDDIYILLSGKGYKLIGKTYRTFIYRKTI